MNLMPRMGANQSQHPPEDGANRRRNERHWLRKDLKAYVDDELPAWHRRLLAWHIARCASCRNEAAWMTQARDEFANLETSDNAMPRPELRARILAALPAASPLQLAQTVRATTPQASLRTARRPVLAWGSLAALLLLMVGAFALNLRHSAGTSAQTTVQNIAYIDNKRHVLMVFSAPNASFNAEETVAAITPGSASPDTTPVPDTASEINTQSASSDTIAAKSSPYTAPTSAATPSDEAYTDPTSREAERLASLQIGKMLNARHLQTLASAKHVAQVSPPVQPINSAVAKPAPQVALAVADVAEARHQIQQWVETAGATMRILPEKGPAPAILAANGTKIPAGTLLELHIPAPFADSLNTHLSQMGTLRMLTPVTQQRHPMMRMMEATEATARTPLLAPSPDSVSNTASSSDNARVTIRVRLLPGFEPAP